MTVGEAENNQVQARRVQQLDDELCFVVDDHAMRLPHFTPNQLDSVLMAYATGRLMGIPTAGVEQALRTCQRAPANCSVHHTRDATLLHDCDDVTFESVRAALEHLRDYDVPGRRVVVCGDVAGIPALGNDAYRRIGEDIVTVCGADLLIACGHSSREVILGARDAGMPLTRAIACRRPDESLPILDASLAPGDAVLVKDSQDRHMSCVIEALRDRPVALVP